MGDTATYLYCIVHAATPPKRSQVPGGVPGATRPSLVGAGRSLWLAAGDVPLSAYGPEPLERALRDMDWVARAAMAHEAVVEHFARQPGVTVIPMKLFTMFSSEARAIAETEARRRDIQAQIDRVAGCEEWGVRLTRAAAPAAARRADAAGPASGAAFLAAKKRARDLAAERRRASTQTADRTFTALAAIAREARRRDDVPAGASAPLLDAAFLVPAGRRARFKSAARRLAADGAKAHLGMTLTGPWPPYNFVQGEPQP